MKRLRFLIFEKHSGCVFWINTWLFWFDTSLSKGWKDPNIRYQWVDLSHLKHLNFWANETEKHFQYSFDVFSYLFFLRTWNRKPPHCFEAAKNWRLVLGNQSVALSEIRSTSMLSPTFLVTWRMRSGKIWGRRKDVLKLNSLIWNTDVMMLILSVRLEKLLHFPPCFWSLRIRKWKVTDSASSFCCRHSGFIGPL